MLIHLSQGGRIDVEEPPKTTKVKGSLLRLGFDDVALLLKEFGTERKAAGGCSHRGTATGHARARARDRGVPGAAVDVGGRPPGAHHPPGPAHGVRHGPGLHRRRPPPRQGVALRQPAVAGAGGAGPAARLDRRGAGRRAGRGAPAHGRAADEGGRPLGGAQGPARPVPPAATPSSGSPTRATRSPTAPPARRAARCSPTAALRGC